MLVGRILQNSYFFSSQCWVHFYLLFTSGYSREENILFLQAIPGLVYIASKRHGLRFRPTDSFLWACLPFSRCMNWRKRLRDHIVDVSHYLLPCARKWLQIEFPPRNWMTNTFFSGVTLFHIWSLHPYQCRVV